MPSTLTVLPPHLDTQTHTQTHTRTHTFFSSGMSPFPGFHAPGFVISGVSITYIGTQMLVFGYCCRKIGRHQTAMVGCILFSVGLGLLPLFGRYIMCASLFVFAVGYGLMYPCLATLLST